MLILWIFLLVSCTQKNESQQAVAVTPSSKASIASLPPDVRQALISLCKGCKFANFNELWNKTDYMDNLPQRHLARTEQHGLDWLIEYDHGGIASHSHTVIFALTPTVHIVDGGACRSPQKDECEW